MASRTPFNYNAKPDASSAMWSDGSKDAMRSRTMPLASDVAYAVPSEPAQRLSAPSKQLAESAAPESSGDAPEWYGDTIISDTYDTTTVTVILVVSTTRRLITTEDPGELMLFTILSLLVALGLDLIRRGIRYYMTTVSDHDWKYYGKPLSSLYHFACQAETYVLLLQVSTISVWFDVAPLETTTSLKLLIMLTIFLFTGIFLLVWGNFIPSTRPPRIPPRPRGPEQ